MLFSQFSGVGLARQAGWVAEITFVYEYYTLLVISTHLFWRAARMQWGNRARSKCFQKKMLADESTMLL